MLPHILFSINWKGFFFKKNMDREREGDGVNNREQSLATNAVSLLILEVDPFWEYEMRWLQLSERQNDSSSPSPPPSPSPSSTSIHCRRSKPSLISCALFAHSSNTSGLPLGDSVPDRR